MLNSHDIHREGLGGFQRLNLSRLLQVAEDKR